MFVCFECMLKYFIRLVFFQELLKTIKRRKNVGIIIKQHPYNYINGLTLYIEVKVKKLKQNISDNIRSTALSRCTEIR